MKVSPPPPAAFSPGRHLQLFDKDQVADPYLQRAKLSEPSVCRDCGAVYHEGRWQWLPRPPNAAEVRCTACHRIAEDLPAGYVSVLGDFAREHRAEIISRIRHVEEREKKEHPLQRIMAIDEQPDELTVTTTDIHLARGIGEALESAFKGTLDFHYNAEEYLLRLRWQR